jgi:hypothetical protein
MFLVKVSQMRFVVEVITKGGGLPGFLGASCSGNVFSASVFSVVSVSMSAVQRGTRELQFNTNFGGSLTAVDIWTDLVNFLAVCKVLLEICLFHLCT